MQHVFRAGSSALALTLALASCGQQLQLNTRASGLQTQGINGTEILSGGVYRLTNPNSGLVLDVNGVSKASEANVQIWESNGGLNQQWKIEDVGGGYATLKAQHSGLCLDAKGGGWQSGANVQQYNCNTSGAQQWKLVSLGNGAYKLLNRNASLALDVDGSGTTNGTNVQVYTDNGSGAQQWKLERLDGGSTGGGGTGGGGTPGAVKTSYTADTSTNFPNPERGFYQPYYYNDGPLTQDDAKQLYQQGITVVRGTYVISDYRTKPFDDAFLSRLRADFAAARAGGIKVMPIFEYNHEWGGQDAPVDRVLGHLQQLKPVFAENKDVLVLLGAGFIGYWGEWHHSTNNLLDDSGLVNDNTRKVMNALLDAVPQDRMVTLRRLVHKKQLFGDAPLAASEAFGNTGRARVGQENNCFLANKDDEGTYDQNNVAADKNWLAQDNQFVPVEGETCAQGAVIEESGHPFKGQRYTDCPNTLAEFAKLHVRTVNVFYEQSAVKSWKDQGCYAEIARKLGYRYRLLESSIPGSVSRGGTLNLSIKVTNDGWGSAFNPRAVELILRDKSTGQKVVIKQPVSSDHEQDPRFWLPGETHTVTLSDYTVPSNLPAGEYKVLLNLPDPMPSLHDRPEYSIRLANQNTWEASSGYNDLLRAIDIQ